MSKFVAGDLVTLSSAGKKNQHNQSVQGLIGIVTSNNHRHSYPYQVRWIGKASVAYPKDNSLPMKEYEIKFAKVGEI